MNRVEVAKIQVVESNLPPITIAFESAGTTWYQVVEPGDILRVTVDLDDRGRVNISS